MKKNNKLNVKDFINIGIFTAIYVVLGIIVAMFLGFVPITFILLSVINPFICGIPMMLYYSKISKPGMLFIVSLINGLIMIATGMGYFAIILGVIFSTIAELILKSGNYSSIKKSILSYGVFSISTVGCYIPWYLAADSYIASVTSRYGAAYTNSIASILSNWWVIIILAIGSFLGGIVGGILGKKVFNKHFKRSGII